MILIISHTKNLKGSTTPMKYFFLRKGIFYILEIEKLTLFRIPGSNIRHFFPAFEEAIVKNYYNIVRMKSIPYIHLS
jgi:hypothetical protein